MFGKTSNRRELASGIILKPIKINGYLMPITLMSFSQKQEIKLAKPFIQGGPGLTIGTIGKKYLQGDLNFIIKVDENGIILNGCKEILKCAERPGLPLTISGEGLISYKDVTADGIPVIDNKFLEFETVVITKCSIVAKEDDEINVKCNLIGMIDDETIVDPFDTYIEINRSLTWIDTDLYRTSNDLRRAYSFAINIESEVPMQVFLTPYNQDRNDQIDSMGVKSVMVSGEYIEYITMNFDKSSFIHGGFNWNETINFILGPITTTLDKPLFEINDQILNAEGVIERKISFYHSLNPPEPLITNATGPIFTFA